MLTSERLQAIGLELPGTEAGTAWGQPVVKVGKTSLYFWNPKYGPVFFVSLDMRDFWIGADPETFFTTDHHANYPCVLARPERVDEDWVRQRVRDTWLVKAPKKLLKAHPSLSGNQ